MAGQNLHGEGKYTYQIPEGGAFPDQAIDGAKQQRRPSHGREMGEVPGIDVQKEWTGEHIKNG